MGRIEVRNGPFVLHVGDFEERDGAWRLTVPKPSLFDQLIGRLEERPLPKRRKPTVEEEARAAAAVCLRWGSYLSLLMDDSLPLAAAATTKGASRALDGEMARINIEASANLARWLSLAHEEPAHYARLVAAAQALPMPPSLPRRPVLLTRMASEEFAQLAAPLLARAPEAVALAAGNPVRVLANCFVNHAWRNGPIESFHGGAGSPEPLVSRRFAPQESTMLMQDAMAKLGDAMEAASKLRKVWATPNFAQRVAGYAITPSVGPSEWTTGEESREIVSHAS